MKLEIIPGFSYPQQIRQLLSEYTDYIIQGDPEFRDYLSLQNFEEELAHLEHKYGPPSGRLYLARCNGEPAGCIALRQLDETSCEMKRLYVRPQFQGQHIGRKLTDKVIRDAKEIGYSQLLLDTFPFLDKAIGMYNRRGFQLIPRYNDSPMESTIYMKLDL